MLIQRFYYGLKPYLPWRVRMAMRRVWATSKRGRVSEKWPIDPAASRVPDGWPGWPNGKKFAFVVSHDVEGASGLENCRNLAALDQKFGFRSSFNFIPEGSYSVPPSLRSWLLQNGFEVGVHDLEHDGKLFQSRIGFERKAKRINRYLAEWNALGFRSGFMLRNLDWLHDLNIGYDSSTFDTDPFEPQSEGAGTVFPFWVATAKESAADEAPEASAGAAGYMELPYTLPQDSTLFLVLQESSPEIWLRKVDWIAEHGGMALVNVHPDYLRFDGKPTARTYPSTHYLQLLQHVCTRHAGKFWHALPSQVAEYTARHFPQAGATRMQTRGSGAALPAETKRTALPELESLVGTVTQV